MGLTVGDFYKRESESAEGGKTVKLNHVALALENDIQLTDILPREMTPGFQ